MPTIAERVAKGVEWLDSRIPDWWQTHKFSLDRFNMSDGCACVVGQLSPHTGYDDAVDDHWLDLDDGLARDRGFFAGDAVQNAEEYDDLTDEWRRVITSRREATA